MDPIVIYGSAVQEARNRIKSAQISTMVEVLRAALFVNQNDDTGSTFAQAMADIIEGISTPEDNAKAAAALSAAKTRVKQFMSGTNVEDIFALADALRWVGEYIELGGGNAALQAFRAGLRNPEAFSSANRARKKVPDFKEEELPDLGIFKNRLLDRSVVKYMERFYGPYIGADISGTTTDSLAVLAYLMETQYSQDITKENLQTAVSDILTDGSQMVPVASMVLQYHHSLIETGLALVLASSAMSPGLVPEKSVIPSFNFYDFTTLSAGNTGQPVTDALSAGNTTLSGELNGCGLVILRDYMDIRDNDHADTEIGLLISDAKGATLFNLGTNYDAFKDQRVEQTLTNSFNYRPGDPSLAVMANEFSLWLGVSEEKIRELILMNSLELAAKGYHKDLDKALDAASDDAQAVQSRAAAAVQNVPQVVEAAATGAQKTSVAAKGSVSSDKGKSGSANQAKQDLKSAQTDAADVLKRLNPQALVALEKLLGAL